MFCNKFKMFLCLIALAALMAWTGSASATLIVSHDGPTTFNGEDDYVSLSNVTIGSWGKVELEFKADDTEDGSTLWFMLDDTDNSGYLLMILSDSIVAPMWTSSTYQSGWDPVVSFTDTTSWHSLSLQWRSGYIPTMTLDGTSYNLTSSAPTLPDFTSSKHVLGRYSSTNHYFDGEIRNVKVYDTCDIPEPSTFALLIAGLIGLLAYAWRKRK